LIPFIVLEKEYNMNTQTICTELEQKHFTIFENDNFNECLFDIFKKSNVGDIVDYITNNQLGVKIYEIGLNQYNKKIINEIGDIYGLYNDPNRFND